MRKLGLHGIRNAPGVSTHRNVRNGRMVHSAIRASFSRQCARQTTTAVRAKDKDNLIDVEVVFDGVEDDELGFADSASSVTGLTGSIGVVADQLTEVAMRFVPEGTSFEAVRVAVVGGIVLVVLSFVKGLLSLVLAVGTIGFGAYLYTSVYGDVGGNPGSTRRAGSERRRTKKKKKASTKGSAARPTFSAGDMLSGLINRTVQRKADDGLLDVTFKKPSKPKNPKKR